jgi:hypothetical protein
MKEIKMAFTTFSGPVRAGTVKDTTGTTVGYIDNTGVVVLVQAAALPATAGTTIVAVLPAGSQILDIQVDTPNVFNSATTLVIGDGTTANKFVTSTTITTAGRDDTSATKQWLQFINIGTTDVAIVATTAGSAVTGAAWVTVTYAQKTSTGAENPISA